ncbi:methyltransferase domain-containing protein [Pseudarthrobacter equi]|uniref:methyltransferase domain-containing protein n=1 Tax=Pseudarthrobacter equi TaxID=728066 RepID=UPI0021C24616|nr:methyltransferase domain-containing protein [Pseudarthrobacter equi]MCT9627505.1 methyltransferase domain-containing protein [Pseudarthrobacter equi]
MPLPNDLPLLCPLCLKPLAAADTRASGPARMACGSGHSFDAARQGYFNMLVGKGTSFEADTAAMADARCTFLGTGHYAPLAGEVAAAVVPCLSSEHAAVLDAGTGTGHYLRAVLDAAAAQGRTVNAVGLDISKFALRRAARLNPEAVNLVWDVWKRIPLADGSVDAVTVIFAPRNPAEFARVLRPHGRLVVVTPRAGHLSTLAALTGMLGIEEGKDSRLASAMAEHFDAESATDVDIPLSLTRREAADLAFMGPAGHHQGRDAIADRLGSSPEPLAADAKFKVLVYRSKSRL